MHIQESGEMYLEHIYMLEKKGGMVRATDVATATGYSKPSVSRAMGLLKTAGLISVGEDGGICLTEEGRRIAHRMYERHTILTGLFVKLGVPEDVATHDACKIEHDLSETTFDAIRRLADTL